MNPEIVTVGTILGSLDDIEMNPEIVTVGTILTPFNEGGNETDDDDIFQCGKCKKQFFSLGTFLRHKKNHKLGTLSIAHSLLNDASNEPDLQLQPIVLSEADILSFSIGQTGYNLSTPDQSLNGFEESATLLTADAEELGLGEASNLSNTFELRSTQIVLTTQITNEVAAEDFILPHADADTGQTLSLDQPVAFLDNNQLVKTDKNITDEEDFKELAQIETVKREEEQRSKEAKLKCPYCLKQFNKNFDLQQHMRCHTGERPFQCVVCGRCFTQKSNVKKHMATHKVWPYRIKTLPDKPIQKISTSTTGETLVVDESFVCQYCPESFSSFSQLKTHRKNHANSKIFKCVQKNCLAVFETLDEFLDHTATHHTGSDAQYRCSHCRQPFHSLDDLGKHQRMHKPCRKKKQSALVCKVCKRKFCSMEKLERHQMEDPHSYPCPECNKVYVCERHLRRHLTTHSLLPTFACTDCGKSFKTAQNLSVHKLVHSSERPFVCKFCPASFARQDRLIRHTFIHDPNRRYKCPFSKHLGCKKEFYRKDKLKQHLLTHSASKSLKCRRCSRVFKRSSQLRRHEAVCLSEDKPCKDCGHVTTSLDHYKKTTTASKGHSHVNRRKHRLLEASKKADDGVSTIQVVVVPLCASVEPIGQTANLSS